jgi:ABC-type glycerol-3-phosphate transport system permease component
MKLSTIGSGIIGGLMAYTLAEMGFGYNTIQFYIVLSLMFAYGVVQYIDI